MRSVKVSELKAHLSAYLRRVRSGEEVLICDRNEPVARIVPCNVGEYSEQEKRLIARGVMTPPRKKRASPTWPKPPGRIPDEAAERVWREEREGR
jgi:prevent-host-death family protein